MICGFLLNANNGSTLNRLSTENPGFYEGLAKWKKEYNCNWNHVLNPIVRDEKTTESASFVHVHTLKGVPELLKPFSL